MGGEQQGAAVGHPAKYAAIGDIHQRGVAQIAFGTVHFRLQFGIQIDVHHAFGAHQQYFGGVFLGIIFITYRQIHAVGRPLHLLIGGIQKGYFVIPFLLFGVPQAHTEAGFALSRALINHGYKAAVAALDPVTDGKYLQTPQHAHANAQHRHQRAKGEEHLAPAGQFPAGCGFSDRHGFRRVLCRRGRRVGVGSRGSLFRRQRVGRTQTAGRGRKEGIHLRHGSSLLGAAQIFQCRGTNGAQQQMVGHLRGLFFRQAAGFIFGQ